MTLLQVLSLTKLAEAQRSATSQAEVASSHSVAGQVRRLLRAGNFASRQFNHRERATNCTPMTPSLQPQHGACA